MSNQLAAPASAQPQTRVQNPARTAIRLMAADIEEIQKERGAVEPWHLIERGWTKHEIKTYGPAAAAILAEQILKVAA